MADYTYTFHDIYGNTIDTINCNSGDTVHIPNIDKSNIAVQTEIQNYEYSFFDILTGSNAGSVQSKYKVIEYQQFKGWIANNKIEYSNVESFVASGIKGFYDVYPVYNHTSFYYKIGPVVDLPLHENYEFDHFNATVNNFEIVYDGDDVYIKIPTTSFSTIQIPVISLVWKRFRIDNFYINNELYHSNKTYIPYLDSTGREIGSDLTCIADIPSGPSDFMYGEWTDLSPATINYKVESELIDSTTFIFKQSREKMQFDRWVFGQSVELTSFGQYKYRGSKSLNVNAEYSSNNEWRIVNETLPDPMEIENTVFLYYEIGNSILNPGDRIPNEYYGDFSVDAIYKDCFIKKTVLLTDSASKYKDISSYIGTNNYSLYRREFEDDEYIRKTYPFVTKWVFKHIYSDSIKKYVYSFNIPTGWEYLEFSWNNIEDKYYVAWKENNFYVLCIPANIFDGSTDLEKQQVISIKSDLYDNEITLGIRRNNRNEENDESLIV